MDSIEIPLADVTAVLTHSVGMRGAEFTGDSTSLTSESEERISWTEHFKTHYALRNLIALCVWAPVDFLGHEVRHTDSRFAFRLVMRCRRPGVISTICITVAAYEVSHRPSPPCKLNTSATGT